VQRFRPAPLTALVLALLLTEVGCGQFFPGANSITALQVTPSSASIQPGVTQQYTATATYGNNTTGDVTSQVSWSTTPTTVATITNAGVLTGVALGTATVSAQSGGVIASTPVTVTQLQVTSITISPPNGAILSLSTAGQNTVQFTATATYANGSTANVTGIATWTSVPSSVATISNTSPSNGLVTAVTTGNATITATSGGVTSVSATVTVNP
jgi:trimeric autotransporter adhesin